MHCPLKNVCKNVINIVCLWSLKRKTKNWLALFKSCTFNLISELRYHVNQSRIIAPWFIRPLFGTDEYNSQIILIGFMVGQIYVVWIWIKLNIIQINFLEHQEYHFIYESMSSVICDEPTVFSMTTNADEKYAQN